MKLNKANTSGSVSVIIPKAILTSLGWKIKDNVGMLVDKDEFGLYLKIKKISEGDNE